MNNLILSAQAKTLTANLPNFKKTVAAYKAEIVQRPFESDELTAEMIKALEQYQQRDLSGIPPRLPRQPGDTQEQHVEKLYKAYIEE